MDESIESIVSNLKTLLENIAECEFSKSKEELLQIKNKLIGAQSYLIRNSTMHHSKENNLTNADLEIKLANQIQGLYLIKDILSECSETSSVQ